MEPFRRHSDNRERRPVDTQRRPNRRAVRVVMVLPITLADDHHRVRVLRVIPFRPREETPRLRLHAHEVEEIAGHHFAPNLRGSRRVTYREYVSHSRGYEVDQMQVVA